MDIKQIFLIVSTVIGFITPIIGIKSVLNGTYKPHRITRLVILIVTVIFIATLYFQGDRNGLFLALAQGVGGILIFILSLKYGVGGASKSDWIIFAGAMISLIVWKTTDNPTLGLYASIITDLIGFFPTLIKSWKDPTSENWKFYGSDVLASFFNLLALRSFLLMDVAFPFYIFLLNFATVLILLYRNKKVK